MEEFFVKKEKKEKRKLIIKVALLSTVISITVFCIVTSQFYSYIRYRECLNNNTALWSFKEGQLQLVGKDKDISGEIYSSNGMTVRIDELGNIYSIVDENVGSKKFFQDNILEAMLVQDRLADFISYFNPRVWFGGIRSIKSDKIYHMRTSEEIYELKQWIKE